MAKASATLLAALVSAVLLTGCAGTTKRAHQPSARAAAAYLAEGNAICAAQTGPLYRIAHSSSPEQSIADLPSTLSALHAELASLRTLDAPRGAHAELTAAAQSTRELASLLAHLLHQLRDGTTELIELIAIQHEARALHAQLDTRFRRAGLTRCAQ